MIYDQDYYEKLSVRNTALDLAIRSFSSEPSTDKDLVDRAEKFYQFLTTKA